MIPNDNNGVARYQPRQSLERSESFRRGRLATGEFVGTFQHGQPAARISGGLFVLGSTELLGSFPPATQRRHEPKDESHARDTKILTLSFAAPFRSGSLSDQENEGWLEAALGEWEEIDEEAAEEGFPPISETAKRNARHIVTELAKGPYPSPALYPTRDGEVAILFQERKARASVLILCDDSGGCSCFSTIEGKNKRARYDDATELPDEFIRGQLLRLKLVA